MINLQIPRIQAAIDVPWRSRLRTNVSWVNEGDIVTTDFVAFFGILTGDPNNPITVGWRDAIYGYTFTGDGAGGTVGFAQDIFVLEPTDAVLNGHDILLVAGTYVDGAPTWADTFPEGAYVSVAGANYYNILPEVTEPDIAITNVEIVVTA